MEAKRKPGTYRASSGRKDQPVLTKMMSLTRRASMCMDTAGHLSHYRVKARELRRLVGGCTAAAGSCDDNKHPSSGLPRCMRSIRQGLKKAPAGKAPAIKPEPRKPSKSDILRRVPGGLHQIYLGMAVAKTAVARERQLQPRGTWSTGFKRLPGGAFMSLARGNRLKLPVLPELFRILFSYTVQRNQFEEALRQTLKELEKKVAESTKELKISAERFRALTENALDGILIVDTGGIIRYLNPALKPIMGYTDADVCGHSIFEFVHPENLEDAHRQFQLINSQPETAYDIEVRVRYCDGSWGTVEVIGVNALANPAVRGIILNVRDITASKRAEESLRKNEQQLESLIQNMYEGVVLADVYGRILKINPAALQILGLKEPRPTEEYYTDPSWQGRVTLDDGTVITGEGLSEMGFLNIQYPLTHRQSRLEFPDGTTRWLRGSGVPMVNPAGGVDGMIFTFIDDTEARALQKEKEQFTRKLLEIQETERKRIARELHDDTAQTLAILSLEMGSMIKSQANLTPAVEHKLECLKSNLDRAMQDIRRYSHELRPGILDYLGLEAAIEQLVEESREHSGLEIVFTVKGGEYKLPEDAELALFRITQEALSNVRKHAQATLVSVTLERSTNEFRLVVSDNGVGFDPEQRHLFATKGKRMGLIGMEERAHLIGARLEIKSRPGQGTTIIVELPQPPASGSGR